LLLLANQIINYNYLITSIHINYIEERISKRVIGMTLEERDRIISSDYADLLITYSGNMSVFERFPDATIHIIDVLNAIVHVPVQQITNKIIAQLGYSVMPSLFGLISQASLEASEIYRLRTIPNFNLRGQGVLIGILDTGIDYTNPIFKYADNTTKIVSIWDQTIFSENFPEQTYYGTEYTRDQINQALQSETPFELVPTRDEIGHGTMLAGISVGNEVPENDFYGVAPDAELVVVKLKQAKPYLMDFFGIPENAVCYQENDILFALDYIYNTAVRLNRPIAICVALGTSQGAHDGRGTLSSFLSRRSEDAGVGVVIAAGNEGNARRHYFGIIESTAIYDTVELYIGENEVNFSMELWGNSPGLFTMDVKSPSGEFVPRIIPRLDENIEISFMFEQTTIYMDYQLVESQSGDQLILLRFRDPAPGIWTFNVYESGDLNVGFHIWLPMEGFISDRTYFIRSDPYTTILSLGNGIVPITVTAYNYTNESLYLNSSRGNTRIGVIKPELAAPGMNITSATLDGGFAGFTGTSAAAAHMTGVVAMMLQWAIIEGNLPRMTTQVMKIFFIRGASRNMEISFPNKDWGYGILDIYNVFDRIRRGL
jgi:subtilisin family serine protease